MVKAELLISSRQPDDLVKGITLLQTLLGKNPAMLRSTSILAVQWLPKGIRMAPGCSFWRQFNHGPLICRRALRWPRCRRRAAITKRRASMRVRSANRPGVDSRSNFARGQSDAPRPEYRGAYGISKLLQAFPGNREVRFQTAVLDLREKKFADAERAFGS